MTKEQEYFDEHYAKVEKHMAAKYRQVLQRRVLIDELYLGTDGPEWDILTEDNQKELLAHYRDVLLKRLYWNERIEAAQTPEEREQCTNSQREVQVLVDVLGRLLGRPGATPTPWRRTIPVDDPEVGPDGG